HARLLKVGGRRKSCDVAGLQATGGERTPAGLLVDGGSATAPTHGGTAQGGPLLLKVADENFSTGSSAVLFANERELLAGSERAAAAVRALTEGRRGAGTTLQGRRAENGLLLATRGCQRSGVTGRVATWLGSKRRVVNGRRRGCSSPLLTDRRERTEGGPLLLKVADENFSTGSSAVLFANERELLAGEEGFPRGSRGREAIASLRKSRIGISVSI
ncbi:ribosomal RNA small subunit methyltransferase H, partial [Striga asiatica]